MNNKISFVWSLAAGLLFIILSLVMSAFGAGGLNSDVSITDYVVIFLAGMLTGAVLIYFLRRSASPSVSRAALIAFLLSLPFAMFGIAFGGLVGWIGIFLLSVSPSIFLTGVGYYLGRAFAGK